MIKFIKIISGVIILLIAFFFFSLSCKKKSDKLTISGYVYEGNESVASSNVHVSLLAQEMVSGVWSSSYESVNSLTTGSDGKFSFTFDIMKVTGYRLTFDKPDYFTITRDFNGNVVSNGGNYYNAYQIFPVAYLKIHIKNIYPDDSSDYLSYRIIGGTTSGIDCCSDSSSSFLGMSVDVTKTCKIYANQNIQISWLFTKNNISHPSTTNIDCPAFDTTLINLFY